MHGTNTATSLGFSVVPTDPYRKFPFVFAVTESGGYDPDSDSWSGWVHP